MCVLLSQARYEEKRRQLEEQELNNFSHKQRQHENSSSSVTASSSSSSSSCISLCSLTSKQIAQLSSSLQTEMRARYASVVQTEHNELLHVGNRFIEQISTQMCNVGGGAYATPSVDRSSAQFMQSLLTQLQSHLLARCSQVAFLSVLECPVLHNNARPSLTLSRSAVPCLITIRMYVFS